MYIIIASRTPKQFYNVQSIVSALLAKGTKVKAFFDETLSRYESRSPLSEFAEKHPGFSFDFCEGRKGISTLLLHSSRELLSYRRFLLSKTQSLFYAQRWRKNIPLAARIGTYLPGFSALLKTKVVSTILQSIEEKTAPVTEIVALIKKESPDAVLATPLTMHPQAVDTEFFKAATALGILTVLPVFTWDNLTTKGLIHIKPALLLAWNEKQATEAETHHGIPRERIEIIGAPPFDRWFAQIPVEKFTSKARKTILYVGTSKVTAEDESWLVKEIAAELKKSSDEQTRNALIFFRPHPFNREIVRAFESGEWDNVKVLETESRMPNTFARFAELRAEILGADLVCGVSTSAFVDAIIADKPVVAVSVPQYKETQEGAEHWRALSKSGAVFIARDARVAVKVFEEVFAGKDDTQPLRSAFVARYVRSVGRTVVAGEKAAEVIMHRLREF